MKLEYFQHTKQSMQTLKMRRLRVILIPLQDYYRIINHNYTY